MYMINIIVLYDLIKHQNQKKGFLFQTNISKQILEPSSICESQFNQMIRLLQRSFLIRPMNT